MANGDFLQVSCATDGLFRVQGINANFKTRYGRRALLEKGRTLVRLAKNSANEPLEIEIVAGSLTRSESPADVFISENIVCGECATKILSIQIGDGRTIIARQQPCGSFCIESPRPEWSFPAVAYPYETPDFSMGVPTLVLDVGSAPDPNHPLSNINWGNIIAGQHLVLAIPYRGESVALWPDNGKVESVIALP